MNPYLIVITSILIFSLNSYGDGRVILSEKVIKEMIQKSPPSVQQIEASFLGAKTELMSKSDRFGLRLDGGAQFNQSKERLLSNFDGGVTQSSSSYSLGLVKPTAYGVEVGVKAFGGKAANAFVTDAATAGVALNLRVDLFKNFLGRSTNSDLKKSELSVQRAELEKKSSLKTFETNVRKLYWALVANNEQKNLLTSLVSLAEKQYKDAVKRRKSGVADSGEVARYRSQWTTRKANLLSLGYRKSEILKSLKELLPELNDKEVVLYPYNVDSIIQKVLICTSKIDTYRKAPVQFTDYDEIVDLLKKEGDLERRVARAYGDPEVTLTGEYASVGRDFGYEAAQTNYYSDPRARESLGVQISIPLGSRTRDNSEVKEMLAKNRYQAQAESNLAKIKAYHSETTETIKLLQQVVRNQKDTNASLAESLKLSRRKFKQARISLQELISERDSHLQSRLNEIDTNLTIINTLMDYFSIYADTPCEFNRI